MGAVSRVVSRSELDAVVDETVDSLLRASPSSTMIGRDSFYGMAEVDVDTALDRLQLGLTEIAMSEDAAEGVRAFLDKREPTWTS